MTAFVLQGHIFKKKLFKIDQIKHVNVCVLDVFCTLV